MKKTGKIVLTLCLMMTMTMAAFAQNSNSYNATAETIRNDIDFSLNPSYYMDAEFKDCLTYFKIDGHNLDLDFSKVIGNLYLGTSYNGNLWGNASSVKNDGIKGVTATTYKEINKNKSENNFEILFGFMNLGARVDFSINPDTTKTKTTTVTEKYNGETTSDTKESKESSTTFSIGGTLGGSFDLGSVTLKPTAYFGGANMSSGNSNSGKFLMNLGSNVILGKKSVTHTFGLLYKLDTGYASENKKDIKNDVNLSYRASFDLGSKAKIGTLVTLDNSFNSVKITDKDGNVTSNTFVYKLTSNAALGVKYNASKDFAVNVGMNMNLPNVESTTHPGSSFNIHDTKSNCDFTSHLYTGCDWTLGNNWMLDMSLDFAFGEGPNKNIFSTLKLGVSYRK